jgi:hypothetical protein
MAKRIIVEDATREYDLGQILSDHGDVFERVIAEEGMIDPSSEPAPKLEVTKDTYHEMAARGIRSLAGMLEEKDPSSKYKAVRTSTGRLHRTDAFERQLALRDIVISGPNAAKLEVFYETANRFLFPEVINRNLLMGMLMSDIDLKVEDMIDPSMEVTIDQNSYQSGRVDLAGSKKKGRMADVEEGTQFPECSIKLLTASILLRKMGGKIKGTYEALGAMTIPMFAKVVQFVGMMFGSDMADYCVSVALASVTANALQNSAVALGGTLAYDDLVRWRLKFRPYGCRLIAANEKRAGDLLTMEEFKDPTAGFNYQATGEMISPFNSKLRINTTLADAKLLGIDNKFAMYKILRRNGSLTETESIIDGQWKVIVFSEQLNFGVLFPEAIRTLTI